VGEGFSLTSMGLVVCHGDGEDAGDRVNGSNMYGILGKVDTSRLVAIDVGPCLRGVECQFVGAESNDGAVLFVEFAGFEGKAAFECPDCAGDLLSRLASSEETGVAGLHLRRS